jgi:hypothetical protein
MEKSDGQRMVKAFHYVRDVYRNVSRMLLSCDELMKAKQFSAKSKSDAIPKRTPVLSPGNISDTWLPCYVVRHYHNISDPRDLITIGTVTCDVDCDQFDMPLCIASRMLVNDTDRDALMWVSIIQMWDTAARPDGEVRVLSEASWRLPDKDLKEIAQHLYGGRGGRILSVACPLLEVCNEDVLEKRLINPLLERGRTPLIPVSGEEGVREKAEQGDAEAQVKLGCMYRNGQGPPPDAAEAVRWYRKAAEQHNANGQVHLGWMYREGQGVGQDDTEAVFWFRKAAEQGNVSGQVNLGWMFEYGRGTAADKTEAIKWYRKAAEQGNKDAADGIKRINPEG